MRGRWLSLLRTRRERSSTTTSAQSISSSGCSARRKDRRRGCSSLSGSGWRRCGRGSRGSSVRATRSQPARSPSRHTRKTLSSSPCARRAVPRPQLHRHRAHPACPHTRDRERCRPDPARLRRRRGEGPRVVIRTVGVPGQRQADEDVHPAEEAGVEFRLRRVVPVAQQMSDRGGSSASRFGITPSSFAGRRPNYRRQAQRAAVLPIRNGSSLMTSDLHLQGCSRDLRTAPSLPLQR